MNLIRSQSRLVKYVLARLPVVVAISFSLLALVMLGFLALTWQHNIAAVNTYLVIDNTRRAVGVSERLNYLAAVSYTHLTLPTIYSV